MPKPQKNQDLDLSAFPPETYKRFHRHVCLSCIFQIFTKQLGMAPRASYTAVRAHTPSIDELTGRDPVRPYFDSEEKFPRCPHCDATKGRLARFETIRLDSARATQPQRKELLDSLPKTEGRFEVVEVKASRRELLFQWLEDLGNRYDFTGDTWMLDACRAFLEKRDPKTNWEEVFAHIKYVRRSRRLEEGWEVELPKLFLAPSLYDEVLLMQYLVSRSHLSGGRTFEGRLTIVDLLRRLRQRGYLREHEIEQGEPIDILEQLVESLDPGGASTKVVYIIDRRDFLEKAKAVYAKYSG